MKERLGTNVFYRKGLSIENNALCTLRKMLKDKKVPSYKAQWENMPHFSSYLRKRADFGTIMHIVKK